MNIFIIGRAQSFKTSFSKELAKITGFNHIQASSFLREKHPTLGHSPHDAVQLSIQAIEDLKEDPFVCINSIKSKLKQNNIIEGVRNPVDFAHLFNPQTDKIVFLHNENVANIEYSQFEVIGLEAIKEMLTFYKFIYKTSTVYFSISSYNDVSDIAAEYKREVLGL